MSSYPWSRLSLKNYANQWSKNNARNIAGHERFQSLTRSFYRGVAGVLMIYDVSRRSTYNHLNSWLKDARNLTSNPDAVIVLIGNKYDLEAQRDVTFEEHNQFAEENGLMFKETSTKTGDGVEEAFLETAHKIYQIMQDNDLITRESGVILSRSSLGPESRRRKI